MKRILNFAVLLGLLVPAGLLLAQTPARMALPTGGLNPPAMSSPAKAITAPATVAPVRPIPVATPAASAPPVLVAAQPVIAGTSMAKPAGTIPTAAPTTAAPAVLPVNGAGTTTIPVAAPVTTTAANPFELTPASTAPANPAPAAIAPATPAPQKLAPPEFHSAQKPPLPETTTNSSTTPRYGRLSQPQAQGAHVPNRIRDCLLKASDEVQLPAQEAGVLVELLAKEGHEVRKDQPLGRIDDAQPRLQRKAAEAERNVSIEKGKSTINERYSLKASEVAKQKWLKGEQSNRDAPGSVSLIEILENKLMHEKALLEFERAQEERKVENLTVMAKDVDVEAAEDAIRRRQLIAPINGTIVEITPHVGEWLKPGDPVLKIVNLEILKIEGYVNIEHFRQDKLRNQTVDAYVDVGEKLPLKVKATITFVSPVVEPGGEYRIKAEIQNGKNSQTGDWYLKPGLNAELVLSDETAKK